ncbi:MAG: ATP-binding cassette domain-containing protein, partial [Chloroflexota bacterium]
NGAGKSTLMKILSGFVQPDQGEIIIDGTPVTIKSPADAIKQGIGMLHQDPLDFYSMRVIDNLIIGHGRDILPDRKKIKQRFIELGKQYGFTIDPDDYVDSLTVGERQQLEILRLLMLDVNILILDEPTTGISALQKEKLFETLRLLAEQGMIIIFVSHKLEEIENLCHQVAVLRGGKLVGETQQPFNIDDLVTLMFEKAITFGNQQKLVGEQVLLKITDLETEDQRLQIKGVNLEVHAGEVIGLAGMEGSGQRLFLRTCGGLIRPVGSSMISVNDENLTRQAYSKFLKMGVAYVPADRMEEGLIPGLTLNEHFALAEKATGFLINHAEVQLITEERIKAFNIQGMPLNCVEELSGGNQQRALMALLKQQLNLLLVEHPVRGLDIESTIWIWNTLKERCKQGAAIIFISSDLDQILRYSDRILVFFGGKVSAPILASETTVDQIGQLIGGKGFS